MKRHGLGVPLRATAESIQWRPLPIIQRLGFMPPPVDFVAFLGVIQWLLHSSFRDV